MCSRLRTIETHRRLCINRNRRPNVMQWGRKIRWAISIYFIGPYRLFRIRTVYLNLLKLQSTPPNRFFQHHVAADWHNGTVIEPTWLFLSRPNWNESSSDFIESLGGRNVFCFLICGWGPPVKLLQNSYTKKGVKTMIVWLSFNNFKRNKKNLKNQ